MPNKITIEELYDRVIMLETEISNLKAQLRNVAMNAGISGVQIEAICKGLIEKAMKNGDR